MTTLVDSARQVEPKLPGFEGLGHLPAATPVPRFSVVASEQPDGEQLSARTARQAFGELDELFGHVNSGIHTGAALVRLELLAADCFTRRLVPALLRHLEHDDLAAAVENLAEVSGTRTINRAVSVFSSLTYLVRHDAADVFLVAIEALEMPLQVGQDELDRPSPAMRPLPALFVRSLAVAINRADRIMSSETSGAGDALPHPLRPSVEVATVAGHSAIRSLAS